MENFEKRMMFQQPATTIYNALTTGINKWWTEMFEGKSNEQGEAFTIRFGANVFKTMVVEELDQDKKVTWTVSSSLIDIPNLINKTEWIGTKVQWNIVQRENQTELHLTHQGLTPQIECYTICASGWQIFTESLADYINTGVGKPFINK